MNGGEHALLNRAPRQLARDGSRKNTLSNIPAIRQGRENDKEYIIHTESVILYKYCRSYFHAESISGAALFSFLHSYSHCVNPNKRNMKRKKYAKRENKKIQSSNRFFCFGMR